MSKIIVSGVKPFDGEYDLEEDRPFNTHEWRIIKKVSGYMPLTIREGWEGGDPDLIVALAVVAMCRQGKVQRERSLVVAEQLAEAPFDGAAITLDLGDREEEEESGDDAGPPDVASEPNESLPNDSLSNPNTSGPTSRNGSDQSEAIRSAIGVLR